MAGMVEIDENEFQLEIIFLAESLGMFIDLGRCPVKFPSEKLPKLVQVESCWLSSVCGTAQSA